MLKKNKNNKNSFSNNMKDIGNTGKKAGKQAINSLKEIPNLPWKDLPTQGYIILIGSLILMIVVFIFTCKFLI